MKPLFYHLLTTQKIKRWITLLDYVEEKPFTGNELARRLDCTRRTVISDIKEIKELFKSTIILLGDENGYFLELQNPRKYYQKKQDLLKNEPLFLMADTLFENHERTNQELARLLQLPITTFNRVKRHFSSVLQRNYGLNLTKTSNRVVGLETRVRQFFFDFYFTIPLYPEALLEKIKHRRAYESSIPKSKWQMNHKKLQGWLTITEVRLKQGYNLPKSTTNPQICKRLAEALDPTYQLDMSEREKASLFLASIEEHQFLSSLVQTEFMYQFSSASWGSLLAIEEDEKHVYLFKTLIQLLKEFFHLPFELEFEETNNRERGSESVEEKLLNQFITNFLKEKQKVNWAIFVRYNLIGPQVLKEWIKKEVHSQLKELGYFLLEEENVTNGFSIPRLQVTNVQEGIERNSEIYLSAIPDIEEISMQFHQYFEQH
ncbi:transcriptional regulator [Enterococcus casseliflavus]|uniref:helix-turn-helix domain-containing protein n=1 Tax=Enterococcus casseliflavus TaxID=37734 RepID=UPI000DFA094C|nr:helix-turn-helix domain-containing protein [Enterococcus casseliflavus]GEB28756.1 hypothetical protein ECA02_18510 [Enterococcus casseliflavus]STP33520.1 transcriptional regulator [Enterococcus casseliflavus]